MYKTLVENSRRDLKALTQVGNLRIFRSFLHSFSELWIRIGFSADPDTAFYLNADPDPDPDPVS